MNNISIFFVSSIFHLMIIFSGRKLLENYLKGEFKSFQYLLTFGILSIISFFLLLFDFYYILITVKIFLIVFFFHHLLFKKSKNFDYFDYAFLILGIILIFFSYGKMFAKVDAFTNVGIISKDIFFTKINPIVNEYSAVTNKHYSGLIPSLHNFFLSGFATFSEDSTIYINNLFIFSAALILFKDKIKISKKIFYYHF